LLLIQYGLLCHPEPQAKGLLIGGKDEILRRLRRLRMTKKAFSHTGSKIIDAIFKSYMPLITTALLPKKFFCCLDAMSSIRGQPDPPPA
jgi:hypothetical protein